nr:MAG TPA: hypothetical protein [Caudoviricetes sp.]
MFSPTVCITTTPRVFFFSSSLRSIFRLGHKSVLLSFVL